MADYDVYDGDTYIGTISISEGGGGQLRFDEKEKIALPFRILSLLFMAALVIVLAVMCYRVYFMNSDLVPAVIGSLPMLIAIVCTLCLLGYAMHILLLRWRVVRQMQKDFSESEECGGKQKIEDYNQIASDQLDKLRKYYGGRLRDPILKINRIMRHALIFCLCFAVVIGNVPSVREQVLQYYLALIGPLFAYCYLLGIFEYVILYKRGALRARAWLSFLISFVGGPVAACIVMLLVYLVQLPFYTEGAWYFTFEGIEVYVILLCILIFFEIGMRRYRNG